MALLTARLPGSADIPGHAWMDPEAARAAMPSVMHRLWALWEKG
jgi:hypothetical protein